jgi:hypothetical protein
LAFRAWVHEPSVPAAPCASPRHPVKAPSSQSRCPSRVTGALLTSRRPPPPTSSTTSTTIPPTTGDTKDCFDFATGGGSRVPAVAPQFRDFQHDRLSPPHAGSSVESLFRAHCPGQHCRQCPQSVKPQPHASVPIPSTLGSGRYRSDWVIGSDVGTGMDVARLRSPVVPWL